MRAGYAPPEPRIDGVVAMFNMIRAQLFRAVKSRSFIVISFVFAAWTAVQMFSIWTSAQPEYGMTPLIRGDLSNVNILTIYGSSIVTGSPLAVFTGVFVVFFVIADFKSNFIKNLVPAPGGRVAYAAALMTISIAAVSWFTLLGLCVAAAVLCVLGQSFVVPAAAELILWLIQVVFAVFVYCVIVLAFVLLSKNEVVGLVAALALGFGWVETMAASVLLNTPGLSDVLFSFVDLFLAVDLSVLGQGSLLEPIACAFAIAVVVVAGAACVLIMRLRNLG